MTEEQLRQLMRTTLQEQIKPIIDEMSVLFADAIGKAFQIGFETGFNAKILNE